MPLKPPQPQLCPAPPSHQDSGWAPTLPTATAWEGALPLLWPKQLVCLTQPHSWLHPTSVAHACSPGGSEPNPAAPVAAHPPPQQGSHVPTTTAPAAGLTLPLLPQQQRRLRAHACHSKGGRRVCHCSNIGPSALQGLTVSLRGRQRHPVPRPAEESSRAQGVISPQEDLTQSGS